MEEWQATCTVVDYWQSGEGWKWEEIWDKLPEEIIDKMEIYILNDSENEGDETYWELENSGNFYVSSAYYIINNNNIAMQEKGWENIWKIKVPSRVKTFLWLARHEKLPCNKERRRRHLTMDGGCAVCINEKKTVEHIIRKYTKAREVWEGLRKGRRCQDHENMGY